MLASPATVVVTEASFVGTISKDLNAQTAFGSTDAEMIGQPISGTFRYDVATLPPLDSAASTNTFSSWHRR